MVSSSFERPPTAQEAVLAELRRALLEGEMSPGERLNVNDIALRLGVSRAPVRDALRVLEGEEQVRYVPHRGYTVTELVITELFDIYRMRELLESEATALAVPQLTDAEIDAIHSAAEDVSAAVDADDRLRATATNRTFHFAFYEASRHPRLVRSIRHLWDADFARALYFTSDERAKASDRQHYAIVEAARDRDVNRVIDIANTHRDDAMLTLLQILRERDHELPANTEPDAWIARFGRGRPEVPGS